MEPRPHERGNIASALPRGIAISSFNGATSSRTWKPRSRPFERAPLARASMEPRPHERGNWFIAANSPAKLFLLQWSHVLTNVETRSAPPQHGADVDGFNGATSSRTWKQMEARADKNCATWLQWSHVLTNVETCAKQSQSRLWPSLQWSHVLTNVETCGRDGRSVCCKLASMEPRPHERGNAAWLGWER